MYNHIKCLYTPAKKNAYSCNIRKIVKNLFTVISLQTKNGHYTASKCPHPLLIGNMAGPSINQSHSNSY